MNPRPFADTADSQFGVPNDANEFAATGHQVLMLGIAVHCVANRDREGADRREKLDSILRLKDTRVISVLGGH